MKKVVLIGYMGSGKSAISAELSKMMQIDVVETDKLIEEKTNLSISDIFKIKGELFFRKLENQIFREILSNKNDLIISTGGGTPCYYNNHELLNAENCVSIYLKASIDTLYNRLVIEKHNRPLIANLNESEFKEYIAKHLFDRSFYYNQATFVVSIDNKNVQEISKEILSLI
jgi:shikimate kinase